MGYGARGFDLISKPPLQPQPRPLDKRYSATVRLLNTRNPDVGEMFVKTTGVNLIKGKGESSCYGDSGGPLFVGDQQTIVGVTSFSLERVMNLGEHRIGMQFLQVVRSPAVPRFPHSQAVSDRVHNSL